MANSDLAHDALLDTLKDIESIEAVRLVARLKDDRIGNENTDNLYIFVPDLHLVTRQKRKTGFPLGFHHERLLVEALEQLFHLSHSHPEFKLTTIHLGDLFDLWKHGNDDPSQIEEDFYGIYSWLHGFGNGHGLNARMIIGNHDAALAKGAIFSANWDLRLFLPGEADPRIYVTHGDVFDWMEKLPDSIQKFAVYYFENTPLRQLYAGADVPKRLGEFIDFRKRDQWRDKPDFVANAGALAATEAGALPLRHNVRSAHEYLKACQKRVAETNQKLGWRTTSAVIGHTHNARIAVQEDPFFVLMDCGAWKGNYQADDQTQGPNCQIGAICGNDFRVYQLDPNTDRSRELETEVVMGA